MRSGRGKGEEEYVWALSTGFRASEVCAECTSAYATECVSWAISSYAARAQLRSAIKISYKAEQCPGKCIISLPRTAKRRILSSGRHKNGRHKRGGIEPLTISSHNEPHQQLRPRGSPYRSGPAAYLSTAH